MAQAVAHFLFSAFLAAIYRDRRIKDKNKKKFPLHYVLFAGLGGLLPDIDIILFFFLYNFGASFEEIHRTFTHALIFPALLLLLSFAAIPLKNKTLGKHHIKIHNIFLALAFGSLTHIFLDAILIGENIMLFYPLSDFATGLDLVRYLPEFLSYNFIPILDGILLLLWVVYLEWKHKISDFI